MKGTQGFFCILSNAASLATLNKQMLSSLATYDAFHWLSQSPAPAGKGEFGNHQIQNKF